MRETTMHEEGIEQDILRNQFYCVNGNSGYSWMVEYMPSYDTLPRTVRERLQQSPFNICTLCLQAAMPRSMKGTTRERLLKCVENREAQIRITGR